MKRYLIVALAVTLMLGVVGVMPAAAQGPDGVVITNPDEGQTVSGIITVTGAVAFPDFMKYDFFLKSGDDMIWVATGYSPVINGNLLLLDTKTVPDGTYQIVVRKVTNDSNYTDSMGPIFTIENGLTAPQPYPEVEATFLYPAPGKGTVRFRNCTGEGLFLDYNSPEGFKSAGEIMLPPRVSDAGVCPYTDIAVEPAEYRGTAKGEEQTKGINYTLNAEAGKVYEVTYNGPSAGAAALYVAEVEPAERAATDTGNLDPGDPARSQSEEAIRTTTESAAAEMAEETESDATASGEAETMEQPSTEMADSTTEPPSTNETVLPVSGAAVPNRTPYAVAGVALLTLMVIGGVFALRKEKRST